MLALPLARKPDWRRPPLVTLLLVAANVAAFFLLQQDDNNQHRQAVAYYLDSPLPDIEFPAYLTHLEKTGHGDRAQALRRALAEGDGAERRMLAGMRADLRFMEQLQKGEVVTPEHPAYAEWRRARTAFEQRLAHVPRQKWGFVPAQPQAADTLTHMFLHGGMGPLIGNMAFLILVGYVLEAVVGRLIYLGLYLLGGMAAAGMFAFVYANSTTPLVGASGALSALMGAYLALLGLRRIPFFYTFLFDSGITRAPAILLLPVWLGLEAYHLLASEGPGAAYMAHLGGLAAGALLGLGLRLSGQVDTAFLDRDERAEQDTADREKGLEHLANGELEAARERFRALLRRDPNNQKALAELYTIASYWPASDEYHRLAQRIFALPDNDAATLRFKRDTFRDYLTTARPAPRLDTDRFLDLADRFAAGGFPEDAGLMVTPLLDKGKSHSRLPQTLVLLARGFARQGDRERAERYIQVLQERFPESGEAREAGTVLADPDG